MNRIGRMIVAAVAAMVALGLALSPAGGAGRASRDAWIEVRSPNFVVVSNAGEPEARNVAVQFEQIRAVFRDSLSYVRAHPTPIVTILAVKDEDSLRELLPEYWATPGHFHPAGVFANDGFRFESAINLGAGGGNPYNAIYHEYYHAVTTPYFPALPLWFVEGMAEFYGNTVFDGKQAKLGVPSVALIEQLRVEPFIPLDTLLRVNTKSPYYHEEKRVSIFYAESWALAHYLVLGDHQAHRAALAAYLDALAQGATEEQAAARAFGSLDQLQADLRSYINGSSFPEVSVPAPAKIAPSELRVRMLSEAESDAYRGGFLTVHEQFQQARPLLEQAVQLDARSALAQENLALLDYFQDRRGDAFREFSAAIRLDPRNALTRFVRAIIEAGNDSSAREAEVEGDLHEAIAADPNFAPAYAFLASYLAGINQDLPDALSFAQKATSLEPGNATYQFDLAQVLARLGQYDQAEALARRVSVATFNKPRQELLDQLFNYLSRSRAAEARRSAP